MQTAANNQIASNTTLLRVAAVMLNQTLVSETKGFKSSCLASELLNAQSLAEHSSFL